MGRPGGSTGATTTAGAVRPASGEPIVLGAVGTKSGIVGAALEGGFRGLTVWERWVNANGGVQGRPVRIIQVDDGADPGKHAAAVRRLILEEDVVAFIGNIAPFTFSAGAPILEEAGVPAIGGEGADRAWFSSPAGLPHQRPERLAVAPRGQVGAGQPAAAQGSRPVRQRGRRPGGAGRQLRRRVAARAAGRSS